MVVPLSCPRKKKINMRHNSGGLFSRLLPGSPVSTVALIVSLFIVRALTLKVMRQREDPRAELRRQGIAQVRNASFPAFALG